MTNKGKKEGDLEEIEFVKSFNQGKFALFKDKYFSEIENVFAVRVTSLQLSKTSGIKVKPKADAYLIESSSVTKDFLEKNSYLLDEEMISTINHKVISDSGISIKRVDSNNYQIHKFTPDSFIKVFENNFLGAGCLIYIDNVNKKEENSKIIQRWELKVDDFERYFSELLNVSEISEKYELIQKHVNNKIKEMIQINTNIKELVFTGKGVFESPYCADFSYISGELDKYVYSDFIVTQGSNRQVQPTIVIKPR